MMLVALDFHLDVPLEIAIAGEASAEDTKAALRAVNAEFAPNKVVALRSGAADEEGWGISLPLLEGKTAAGGAATVYLCRNFTCEEPLTDIGAVRERLREMQGKG